MSTNDEEQPGISQAIERLAKTTEFNFSNRGEVERAFLLGLWYKTFPDYMIAHLEKGRNWNLENIDPGNKANWHIEKVYPNLQRFMFISDTGDSWHQCYRDLRQLGWQRHKIWREGGQLEYLFSITDVTKPKGFTEMWLLLMIQISTCKQVQVGTKMVEQPIYETKCEDLVEIHEHGNLMWQDNPKTPLSAEIVSLVVIDDVEGVEMPEGQIPTKTEWADDKRTPPFEDDTPF